MPAQSFTRETIERGLERAKQPDIRLKVKQTIAARNAATWLKRQVENSKNVSPDVLAHVQRLFTNVMRQYGRIELLEDSIAIREASRIAARLNWMRGQEKLLNMQLTDAGFVAVSKVMCMWMAAEAKLSTSKRLSGNDQKQKRRVPIPATNSSDDEPNEP